MRDSCFRSVQIFFVSPCLRLTAKVSFVFCANWDVQAKAVGVTFEILVQLAKNTWVGEKEIHYLFLYQ